LYNLQCICHFSFVTTSHIFGLGPIVNIRTCFYWEQRCVSSLVFVTCVYLALLVPYSIYGSSPFLSFQSNDCISSFHFVNLKTCVDDHEIPCGNVAMSIEDQIKRNGSIDYTNPNVLSRAYLKSRACPHTFTILMSCQHLSQTLLEHLKLD
jgi:hypothetical protein